MFDSESSTAEPVAKSINTSLGIVSQSKKHQPHALFVITWDRASAKIKVKQRHDHFPKASSSVRNDWLQDECSAPNDQPGWGEEHPGRVQPLTPVHMRHSGELTDVLPPVELRSALTQQCWQESITTEAADTPGALSLPDPTSLDLCLQPEKGHSLGHLTAPAQFPKGKRR